VILTLSSKTNRLLLVALAFLFAVAMPFFGIRAALAEYDVHRTSTRFPLVAWFVFSMLVFHQVFRGIEPVHQVALVV